jgi:hypothetical protein
VDKYRNKAGRDGIFFPSVFILNRHPPCQSGQKNSKSESPIKPRSILAVSGLCSEVGEKEAKRTSILRLASLHILNGSGIIVRTLGLKRERKMKRYELKKREEKLWIETIRVWSVKY